MSLSLVGKFALAALATGTGFVSYFGVHKTPVVKEGELREQVFVYRPFRGDYWDMKPALKKLQYDFEDIKGKKNFMLSGFYYDNPRNLKNRAAGRAVLGGMFELNEKELVDEFLKKHPEYKSFQTKKVDALCSEFPFKNYWSFRLARMKKLRARLYKYGF